jgi:3-dehydroquinate synthase
MELISLPPNIIFSHNLQTDVDGVLAGKSYSKIFVLTDSNIRKSCYHRLSFLPKHEVIEIEPGEKNKNLKTCSFIWSRLTSFNADRKSLLIILGGGVAGDMGGFCAATYKRGIDFIILPTTLLSQVDASVGGKLGIDFSEYKNHIGVFQEPVATLIHTPFLDSLPLAELRSGFAEIIKHCLLSDIGMWDEIRTKTLDNQDWERLAKHSVLFKAGVVRIDPRESGLRKVLNFGHTIGHALESFFLLSSNRLLHGEAIAIGMIAESWIANKRGWLTKAELSDVQSFIVQIFGKVELPADKSGIIQLTLQDKKNVGDKIQIAVPKGIGNNIWDIPVTVEEVKGGLDYYES